MGRAPAELAQVIFNYAVIQQLKIFPGDVLVSPVILVLHPAAIFRAPCGPDPGRIAQIAGNDNTGDLNASQKFPDQHGITVARKPFNGAGRDSGCHAREGGCR